MDAQHTYALQGSYRAENGQHDNVVFQFEHDPTKCNGKKCLGNSKKGMLFNL